jgi:hypothetical protein
MKTQHSTFAQTGSQPLGTPKLRAAAILSTFLLTIPAFGQLNQFNVTLINAPLDSRLYLGEAVRSILIRLVRVPPWVPRSVPLPLPKASYSTSQRRT